MHHVHELNSCCNACFFSSTDLEVSDLITSSFRTETITYPAILCKISLISFARRPIFLFSGIKRHAIKGLMVWISPEFLHRFWVVFSNACTDPYLLCQNYPMLDINAATYQNSLSRDESQLQFQSLLSISSIS